MRYVGLKRAQWESGINRALRSRKADFGVRDVDRPTLDAMYNAGTSPIVAAMDLIANDAKAKQIRGAATYDTHMGACPRCASRNLRKYISQTIHPLGQFSFFIAILHVVFGALMLITVVGSPFTCPIACSGLVFGLLGFIPKKEIEQTACNDCGYRYRSY